MEDNKGLIDSLRASGRLFDDAVEAAMRRVDRIVFVDTRYAGQSYVDRAFPDRLGRIGPAPSLTALIAQHLSAQPGQRVLVIGAGAPYLCAIVAELVGQDGEVCLIEPTADAAAISRHMLSAYANVRVTVGQPFDGLRSKAPFDRIAALAPVESAPSALLNQLAEGGRMVLPLSRGAAQRLTLVRKIVGQAQKTDLNQTCAFSML